MLSHAGPTDDSRHIRGAVVLLLAAAVFITFAARGVLATARPLIKTTLHLSNSQIGVLLSAFFWSYALLQPLAGWLSQRLDVRLLLAGGLLLWATATALSSLAAGFVSLLVLRVLLGLGESVTYPCCAMLLASRALEAERGRANGFVGVGQALGPTIGTLLGGLAIQSVGWRATFAVFGVLSLIWLVPWLRVPRADLDLTEAGGAASAVPYRRLLSERTLWLASAGHFASNYSYYVVIGWMPLYLVQSHGLGIRIMAGLASGVYALQALSAAVAGVVSDRMIRRGIAPSVVRTGFLVAGLLGSGASMLLCAYASTPLAVCCLLVSGIFFGIQSPCLMALSQSVAGPQAAGRWIGLQNLIANLAGVAAPLATGLIVDRSGSFALAFLLAAVVTASGALVYGLGLRGAHPINWRVTSI